ncbi:S8 family peptidase [Clostridium sp.]|uniref:S8 family peptidase n=1 Tax=Clostridium sp. TaxID=1506 RepID=UPI002FC84488
MASSCEDFFNKFGRELINGIDIAKKGLTAEEAGQYYLNDNYETYLVEYTGDFLGHINTIDYAKVYDYGIFFAVLFVREGMLSEFLKEFPEITNIERSFPFTLLNLNESNELPDLNAISKGIVPLDGEGVVVGIIGTGIDYLNPRFIDENGNSRIVSIWDQSQIGGPIPENFIQGTEYTREDINKAIRERARGNNPYAIVKHRDETGYGTAIATIIGGRKLGRSDLTVSVAPKCEFIIVKLNEASRISKAHWALENYTGIVYDSTDIVDSQRYIHQMQVKLNKPVVMYITVGTNLGAHDGSTVGERFTNYFSEDRLFTVVSSTGDQGGSPICLKETFSTDETEKEINLNVDENQENLFFVLYYTEPDRISVGITSPLGETINKIPFNNINGEELSVTLGESSISVQYFLEQKDTGNQRLNFIIRNAAGGVWKINIVKEYAIYGTVNMWLQQKEFSVGDTGLVQYTPYTTLMTPSSANGIMVTSSYNQIDNTLMRESGRGFTSDNRIIPSVSLPARNILTAGVDNKPIVVSGSAVSGAILTGVVALLFQWGIVQGNDINLYTAKIKSYLIQGTIREEGQIYPNPETGYGVLNIEKLYERLINRKKNARDEIGVINTNLYTSNGISNLYINIPEEIYNKLKFIK